MTSFRLVAALTAAAAIGVAAALRYGFIEPQALNEACWAAISPWWCKPRQGLALLIDYQALGWASLVAAGLALTVGGRGLVLGAIASGGLGVILYNADLAAVGLVLGAVRAIRL